MADLVNVAPGQCRLTVDSSSQLSLQRWAGAYIPLKISGTWSAKLIPGTAPTLSNSGLTAATLYYIYAFDSGGTLTLEASTTAPAIDADTGVKIKNADASRTLVGMVYMGAGTPGTFIDSVTRRLCLNWFNRRSLDLHGTYSADRTFNGTGAFADINSEISLEFLSWADEAVFAAASGTVSNSSGGQASHMGLAVDSTSTPISDVGHTITNANQRQAWSLSLAQLQSEGRHLLSLLGRVSGGTATLCTATDTSIGTSKAHLWASVRG